MFRKVTRFYLTLCFSQFELVSWLSQPSLRFIQILLLVTTGRGAQKSVRVPETAGLLHLQDLSFSGTAFSKLKYLIFCVHRTLSLLGLGDWPGLQHKRLRKHHSWFHLFAAALVEYRHEFQEQKVGKGNLQSGLGHEQ